MEQYFINPKALQKLSAVDSFTNYGENFIFICTPGMAWKTQNKKFCKLEKIVWFKDNDLVY